MENSTKQSAGEVDPYVKLQIAMALIEYKRRQSVQSSSSTTKAASSGDDAQVLRSTVSEADAIKWKQKAKQRKAEILRLKEDLKLAEDGMQQDIFPEHVSCKCYFFDSLGELSSEASADSLESDQKRFSEVLRRRFLRQVRLRARKRRRAGGLSEHTSIADFASENELEQLRASVDFLVDLCETSSSPRLEEGNFKNWSHQSVDFILATLKTLSLMGKVDEVVESVLSSLIVRLIRRMCHTSQGNERNHGHKNIEFFVQHLMRMLGSDPYIGQRIILSVSQRISLVAESILSMDPFDVAFPKLHSCMYIMIQLTEFLVSDYLQSWSTNPNFEIRLFEEWVTSIFHARKALEVLETRNALYMLYMDRVIGDLTRQLGQFPFAQKLQPDTLSKLFG